MSSAPARGNVTMPLSHSPIECPMDSLRLLMGPWTTYILWILRSNGPTRFGELKRRVPGISAKMLTERLRMLEQAGLVFRNYRPTVPPQVTYGLTPRGEDLREVLDRLSELAKRWQELDSTAISAPPSTELPHEFSSKTPGDVPTAITARPDGDVAA